MSRVFHSITEFIGHTPLTEAVNIEKELGLGSRLLLKLEYMNPAGNGVWISVPDSDILEVEALLGRTEGIFGEPAGVASLACLFR